MQGAVFEIALADRCKAPRLSAIIARVLCGGSGLSFFDKPDFAAADFLSPPPIASLCRPISNRSCLLPSSSSIFQPSVRLRRASGVIVCPPRTFAVCVSACAYTRRRLPESHQRLRSAFRPPRSRPIAGPRRQLEGKHKPQSLPSAA